jgi:large subunit ribosomal protein L13
LQGKDNPNREDYLDSGDYVIVTNTKKVLLTGNKLKNKIYYNHSQYPGGLRKRTAKTMIEKYPNEVIFLAVKGMLKKSKLGAKQIKKLFLYPYEAHKHEAQSPVKLT